MRHIETDEENVTYLQNSHHNFGLTPRIDRITPIDKKRRAKSKSKHERCDKEQHVSKTDGDTEMEMEMETEIRDERESVKIQGYERQNAMKKAM